MFVSCAVVGTAYAISLGSNWTVVNNTDWPHNCKHPGARGTSAFDCADQCLKLATCAAVSWNGPLSESHNGYCNFKCSTQGRTSATGEEGVIVRTHNLCDPPTPAPAPPAPPDPSLDPDWVEPYKRGSLLFSDSTGPVHLLPEVGNGFVGHQLLAGTLFVAGVYNGRTSVTPSHRAVFPAFTAHAAAPPLTPKRYALDLEGAAFYTRHTAPACGAAVEERIYAHLTWPNLLVQEVRDNSLTIH
jgi:hypothetical protein